MGANALGSWIVTRIKAEPGWRYRVSAWVKSPAGGEPGSVRGTLNIRTKDDTGAWIDDGSAVVANMADEADGKWVELSVCFTTPSRKGGVWIVPVLSCPHAGKDHRLWFDDLKVERLCKSQ